MSFWDREIKRRYTCQDCIFDEVIKQSITDDFLKTCPICDSDNVDMKCIDELFSVQTDTNIPKTLGALAEKNRKQKNDYLSPEEKKGLRVRKNKRKINK